MMMEEMPSIDTPAPRPPLVSLILVLIAGVGLIVVALTGALAGLLGGWITSWSDSPLVELLGGAVAGCLAGTVGGPYGLYCALAFVRSPPDPYAWRRSITNNKSYRSFLAALVVVLLFIFPATLLWLWLIIALPSALLGTMAFEFFDSIPRSIIGIGLAFVVAGVVGFLISVEFIKPPQISRRGVA